MYIRLVESYLRLFVSRGESYSLAKFSAACALSLAVMANLCALPAFFPSSRITLGVSSLILNPWLLGALTLSLLAFHWLLAGRVSLAVLQSPDASGTRLCYLHLSLSMGLLLVSAVVATGEMHS